jgi:hypothetical protein
MLGSYLFPMVVVYIFLVWRSWFHLYVTNIVGECVWTWMIFMEDMIVVIPYVAQYHSLVGFVDSDMDA